MKMEIGEGIRKVREEGGEREGVRIDGFFDLMKKKESELRFDEEKGKKITILGFVQLREA